MSPYNHHTLYCLILTLHYSFSSLFCSRNKIFSLAEANSTLILSKFSSVCVKTSTTWTMLITVKLSVGEGSLGNCMCNSRLLGGFLSLVGIRYRTGKYREGTSSRFNYRPDGLIKRLLQTRRVLELIGKFFLQIARTYCFKRYFLLNFSRKKEKWESLLTLQ